MTPEQLARKVIDGQLQKAGWLVQDYKAFNPGEGLGIAVREYPTDTGPADYVLFIERKPVGVIEAKPAGTILTPVEEQAERYAKGELKWFVEQKELPFMYLSTGDETRFTDHEMFSVFISQIHSENAY
jgi:type I restriction enzyme R subunit